jgi:hypothetical protein
MNKINNKIDNAKNIIKKIGIVFFRLFADFIDLGIKIIIMFGAICSMILLYKMLPETALIAFRKFGLVINILFNFLRVFFAGIIICLYVYVVLHLFQFFCDIIEEKKKKNSARKKRFMDHLVKKIKKELKK